MKKSFLSLMIYPQTMIIIYIIILFTRNRIFLIEFYIGLDVNKI
jgi:hypothetical protein